MHTDEVSQEKNYKFSAKLSENRLILEINDGSTYRGFVESSPYFDIEEQGHLREGRSPGPQQNYKQNHR